MDVDDQIIVINQKITVCLPNFEDNIVTMKSCLFIYNLRQIDFYYYDKEKDFKKRAILA